MNSSAHSTDHNAKPPLVYRFLRRLVRIWFAVFFRKIRLLGAERLPASAPALVAVGHPASFRDALLLLAASDRKVCCFVPSRVLTSGWQRIFGRALGMIPYKREGEAWRSALKAGAGTLAAGGTIAAFADLEGGSKEPGKRALAAAAVALEAEARNPAVEIAIYPGHLFLPVGRSAAGELLIHIDAPLARGSVARGAMALGRRIEEAWQENAFRIQPAEFRQFLADLEELLLAALEEDFASRPNWKQQAEGFELSRFVAEWTEQANSLDPGRLVALRAALDDYREKRRRWSLRSFRVETGGDWIGSRWRRMLAWAETALGLPVALYGLAQNLLAGILLSAFGLFKKRDELSAAMLWTFRALVVAFSYAAQISICARVLGRTAAGIYAPSLPLSGAYLWRYRWLLRHRTRNALAAILGPPQAAKLRQRRRRLVADLQKDLNTYADALGVAH